MGTLQGTGRQVIAGQDIRGRHMRALRAGLDRVAGYIAADALPEELADGERAYAKLDALTDAGAWVASAHSIGHAAAAAALTQDESTAMYKIMSGEW
jgi:hypothetical protein